MKIIPNTNYMTMPGLQPGLTILMLKGQSSAQKCERIIQLVEAEFDISYERMASRHRYRELVEARYTAIYLLRMHTAKASVFIGALFGGRDHTTILYAVSAVRDWMCARPDFKQRVLKLENQLAAV